MLEVFLKVMDKIHIKEIAFSVLVVCGIILFAPGTFMETLGLFLWRDKYRSMVGLIFLFCLTCCIVWLFIYLKEEISCGNWRLKKIARKYLKSIISAEEKDFLIKHYYDSDTKEFFNTARVDMTSGNVVSLANAYIIYTGTSMGRGPNSWSYKGTSYKPNNALGVPRFWESVINSKKLADVDLSFIKYPITGGDKISPFTVEKINDFA